MNPQVENHTMFTHLLLLVSIAAATVAPPSPTLIFGTTIRVAEAYSTSTGSGPLRDGCLAANARLLANPVISDVVFDGVTGRLRQRNAKLARAPTTNMTSIGNWHMNTPREWDIQSGGSGSGKETCFTELLPDSVCPNGTKACPPTFGTWYGLNAFTSILGMWYPNTTLIPEESTGSIYDTYRLVDVQETLISNTGCGTSTCTME